MQSIAKVLSDMFNPTFLLHSYGYMPGRSVRQAALQSQGFYQQGYTYQIDIDLEKFFDTVNHDILMDRVGRKVKDKGLMKLLGRGISIESRIVRLKQYAQGWMAHYGCGLKYDKAVNLDGWIRRRLRMCYWKQWRRPRRRIRELIKLGVSKREAIYLGISRKSYWRLSKTLATNSRLSNAHFEQIGLISIRTLWCKIHHPATAR